MTRNRANVEPGDPLPDLTLRDAQGRNVALSGFRGEHMLLIHLRHLA